MINATDNKEVSCDEYKIHTHKTADLSSDDLSKIIRHIKELYLWFSPTSSDTDIRDRLLRHENTHISIFRHTKDTVCRGFSVYYTETFCGHHIIFRDGTIVRDRSRGLYKMLMEYSVSPEHHDYIVAMTQNPRVYETLQSFSHIREIFPSPSIVIPEKVREIAERFCKAPNINLDTLIVKGVYHEIRKDFEFRNTANLQVMNFFQKELGPDDGFFVVIPLK